MIAADLPWGRFGKPEEVGEAIAFRLSARSRWIAGSCLVVDGGQGRSF